MPLKSIKNISVKTVSSSFLVFMELVILLLYLHFTC